MPVVIGVVQRLLAGFVPISKLHIPWARSGVFEEQRVKDSRWFRRMMCTRSFWTHAFGVLEPPASLWKEAFGCVYLSPQAWGTRATKKLNRNKSFQGSHYCRRAQRKIYIFFNETPSPHPMLEKESFNGWAVFAPADTCQNRSHLQRLTDDCLLQQECLGIALRENNSSL